VVPRRPRQSAPKHHQPAPPLLFLSNHRKPVRHRPSLVPLQEQQHQVPKPHHSRVPAQACSAPWPAQLRKSDISIIIATSQGPHANRYDLYSGAVVGTSIGHAIGGFFGGGSSHAEQQPAATTDNTSPLAQNDQGQYAMNQSYEAPKACGFEVNSFRKCMDDNRGDLTICGWYLDQLKACQSTASQY